MLPDGIIFLDIARHHLRLCRTGKLQAEKVMDLPPESEIRVSSTDDIGKALRNIRKGNGMTQDDLCRISGVNRRFLSELENGKKTAEIGKVLHVLQCVGCDLILGPRS